MRYKTNDYDDVNEELKIDKKVEVVEEGDYDFSYQLRFHAINRYFNMKTLLEGIGISVGVGNMYCPFHEDKMTGKMSAKFHEDTSSLFCFSESKSYSAFHTLKILYGSDMNRKFKEAWSNISERDKDELIKEYGVSGKIEREDYRHPVWKNLENVYSKFRVGGVDFKKHKIALYKIYDMIYEYGINEKNKAMKG